MLFTLAWRNLWRNRRRTYLTTGSIVLAVVLAVFMRSMQEGVYDKMIENVVGLYTGYVQIHQDGYWAEKTLDNSFELSPELHQLIAADDRVAEIVPRLESFLLASSDHSSQVAQIIGISPPAEDVLTRLSSKVVAGSYLAPQQAGIMIGSGLAAKLRIGLGDSLVLYGQGFQGNMASELLPVVALLQFGSKEMNDRIVYTTLETAQMMIVAPDRLTAYALQLHRPGTELAVTQALREQLPAGYEVMEWREMMPELVQSIESDRLGGYLTMGILYLIIAFGIFGTALMMTAERQYEFGVLTAIGMKKHLLSSVMTLEMILMGVIGVLVGVLISLPIVVTLHYYPIELSGEAAKAYESFGIEPLIPTAIDPEIMLFQAMVVMIMTLLVSIYPTVKIFQLNAIRAMRG